MGFGEQEKSLVPEPLTLPSAPQDCSYFNSNAAPLKLAFQNVDPLGEHVRVIFKVRHPVHTWGRQKGMCGEIGVEGR